MALCHSIEHLIRLKTFFQTYSQRKSTKFVRFRGVLTQIIRQLATGSNELCESQYHEENVFPPPTLARQPHPNNRTVVLEWFITTDHSPGYRKRPSVPARCALPAPRSGSGRRGETHMETQPCCSPPWYDSWSA